MKNPLTTLLLAALVGMPLSGCVPALIGGATIGTLSATDRRSTGAQADDQVMELRAQETAMSYLRSQNQIAGFEPRLSVVSYNRQLLLLGIVATEADKAFVERVARAQPAAQKIHNYIEVAQQGRSFGNVADDSWVTSKVRTTLLKAPGLSPNHVKVVTYNGVTYVMGILTPAEQQSATQVVSTTAGVKKVVTLYQGLETAALHP